MPLDPKFDQYDFNIGTDGRRNSKNLVKDIQNSWSSKTRQQINKVEYASEFKGEIYAIIFNKSAEGSVPTVGSFTDSLIHHGWGYFNFSENTVYVGRIVPSSDPNKKYVFKGRENVQFSLPSIRQFKKNLDIDDNKEHNKCQSMSLIDDIMSVWPEKTIEGITNISCNKKSNSYIIYTKDYNLDEINLEQYPSIMNTKSHNQPLGKHIDVLLHSGWAVKAIKTDMLFISELNILIDKNNTDYRYVFDNTKNDEKSNLAYTPKKCEICNNHEFYGHLVTDRDDFDPELPVYTRSCLECMNKSEYPTADQFKNNDNVKIPE